MELSRRERREYFASKVSEPEALELICDRLSDGETLADLARDFKANYRWLFEWLNDPEHPDRAAMVERAMQARDSMSQEEVVGQLHRLATLDVRGAFNTNGDMKQITDMPATMAKAISSIDVTENERGEVTKKIRFVDRGQMLGLSGRRHRMFVDRVDMTGQVSLEQAVMDSVKPRSE
jgi:hypothetical protein